MAKFSDTAILYAGMLLSDLNTIHMCNVYRRMRANANKFLTSSTSKILKKKVQTTKQGDCLGFHI